jgi:hypothetical protein
MTEPPPIHVRCVGPLQGRFYRAVAAVQSAWMFAVVWRRMRWHDRMALIAEWQSISAEERRLFPQFAGRYLRRAMFGMRIGRDTEELEELQRRREDELLVALTADAQPPDAELAAAPLITGWRLSPTYTAGLYVRGTRDGRDFTTGEVVEIDALRRWVCDRGGALYRLGPR